MRVTIRIIDADAAEARLLAAPESCAAGATRNFGSSARAHLAPVHYDAETTVIEFAARLKDAVDLDAVQADLTSAVQQTLEPAQVSAWISHRY